MDIIDISKIKVVAFDADDTLWINETFFREAEEEFGHLLQSYMSPYSVGKELYKVEIQNLALYGYGIKGFMLSMIETIYHVTNGEGNLYLVQQAIRIGKEQLQKPVELLPDVADVLTRIGAKYKLIVATKGDLLDQQNKLDKSDLGDHFHHVEVMSDKKPADYLKLLRHLDCKPEEFLMIGNSVKSDILPVLKIGGQAIHIPFHTTWEHESVGDHPESDLYPSLNSIRGILPILLPPA